MITFLISLLIAALIAYPMGVFNFKNYLNVERWTRADADNGLCRQSQVGDRKQDNPFNFKLFSKAIACFIIFLLIWAFLPLGSQYIDPGNEGLKIQRFGGDKGTVKTQPCKGLVFYNTWTTLVNEYSMRTKHVDFDPIEVAAKGGTMIPLKLSLNYTPIGEKLPLIYSHLSKSEDLEALEQGFMKNSMLIAAVNATNLFTPDSIFNYASNYRIEVEKQLNVILGKYFLIEQVKPGQTPPKSMVDILQRKANAVQAAQQAELDRQTAEAQRFTKIAQAQGDSASAVIAAAGEAEAIKLKTRELSDNYVQYIKWLNANPDVPRVPQTVLGGNTSVLLSK